YSDRKYADGFIECSSGFERERERERNIDTMTKKCALGVQVIKQTLTLTKMTLSKSGKWKLVEVRSACNPTSWELRAHWNLLFERLATIYNGLLEQRQLD
ncbi:hypothetical protein K501DRAFT_145020, partial [Backusella circina FSU 941]